MGFTGRAVTVMNPPRFPLSVMQWYYSKNATQQGPVTIDELRAKLASGEITATDMVWREGMPDWQPASAMPELAVSPAGPPAMTASSPYSPPSMASGPARGAPIPNYLWQSIVVTILCCWPLGIPAIVYAAKVDGLVARGDTQGAMSASGSAKMWCWIALGAWVAVVGIYLIFAVVMVAFGQAQAHP